MLNRYGKLWDLLDSRGRRNILILLAMIIIMGVMDTAGVASIVPFLSAVSNPQLIHEKQYLAVMYRELGFSETRLFLLFLGGVVFLVIMVGMAFKTLTLWALARFVHMQNYTLSRRLLGNYLGQPYPWFFHRHSADLGKSILSEVQQVISGTFMPTLRLLAHSVISLCLTAFVIWMDPLVALSAVLLFGGVYGGIYLSLRGYLKRIGVDRVRANQERFQIAQEAFGGIKEIKALGLEEGYLKRFSRPARLFARQMASNQIIGDLPRYLLEALAIGGMIVVVLTFLAFYNNKLEQIVPVMGVFVFAGLRLLPALQQVYQNASSLNFGKHALDTLYKDFQETKKGRISQSGAVQALPLKNNLELVNLSYTYPGASQPALLNLDMHIPVNTTIGLVGASGAGKTTVVDLIMGLLTQDSGRILVDGTEINEKNQRSWQRSLGYVPQQSFLADDTVAANIAFGVPPEQIDLDAVHQAGRIAELHDFVTQQTPQGYDTIIGERGVRLSGGQRQRIGIARALYRDPDVLVLDEATSALDNLTEQSVMDAIHNLQHRKTIILIAHRLSTVRKCDIIFYLDKGRLVARGSYEELLEGNPQFRKLAFPDS